MRILPKPKCIEIENKEFNFDSHLDCVICSENIDNNFLSELFHKFTHTGSFLTVRDGLNSAPNTMIFGKYNGVIEELVGEAEYRIHVTQEGVCIKGKNKVSLLYGYYTFLQMIHTNCLDQGNESFFIPCGQVTDWGDVKFRGIDICVFPETSLEFLRKAILLCAFYKYTHVVLRFWGTLKFDALKEMAWEHAYTKDQIRPIIEEARNMGIEIIPMLNHLGHASQARERYGRHAILDQNPRHALLFEEDGWTWCLSNPQTLELLRELREELMELCGEGKYFNLGFDEAYSFASCHKCSKFNKQDLFVNYLNGLAAELKEKGRQGMICGDMFLDREKWKLPIWATGRKEHGLFQCIDQLSKDLIIQDWQYEVQDGLAESTGFFMQKGFQTLVSPWDNPKNIECMTETAIQKKAMGIIATTWDTLPENLWLIGYVGGKTWNNADYEKDLNDINVKTAEILRKLIGKYLGYEKMGWKSNEVLV